VFLLGFVSFARLEALVFGFPACDCFFAGVFACVDFPFIAVFSGDFPLASFPFSLVDLCPDALAIADMGDGFDESEFIINSAAIFGGDFALGFDILAFPDL
jgi:hypothetical protein